MPTLTISIDQNTDRALALGARSLLLGKRQFARAVLAAVARELEQQAPADGALSATTQEHDVRVVRALDAIVGPSQADHAQGLSTP